MISKKVSISIGMAVITVAGLAGAIVFFTNRNSEPMTAMQTAFRVLERIPVIDGHNDLPWNIRALTYNDLRKVNFSQDLTQVEPWKSYPSSFTDIPRLRKGRVGGQFWVAYTACESNYKDAVAQTLEQIDVIKRLAAEYKDDLHFSTSAADIEFAIQNGKIASLIAVEGGHSIQSSLSILRLMYELGARYMTLTHSCNLPWADASPVDNGSLEPVNNGLSPFGLEIVDEMNRLGMMVDLSHVSMGTMKAALGRSKAPVIFSHSSAKAVCDHHRNVPDDVLQLVKINNGIVMVNFYRHFVQCDSTKNATIDDVVAHIQHIRKVIGVDFIGIGADYDGISEVPEGLEDVSSYPALFAALLETGEWSEEDLEKLAGRNLIRVFKDVEKIRDELKAVPPYQDVIKREDVVRAEINTTCVTADFIDDKDKEVKNETQIASATNELMEDENNNSTRTRRHAISFEEGDEL